MVTVPVRNEATRITETVRRLKVALDSSGLTYRISIAEDGSTDDTKRVVTGLLNEYPGLILKSEQYAMGRGRALRELWSDWDADVYCFTDADLASGTDAIVASIRLVLAGGEVIIGSRYIEGGSVNRPPLRRFVSLGYNQLVRLWFRTGVLDHQCGMKVFSRRSLRELLSLADEDSWFWDTQIVVIARRLGLPVEEVPVVWEEKKLKRTSIRRLVSDIYLHGSGLLRLKGRLCTLDEKIRSPREKRNPQGSTEARWNSGPVVLK